jgi:hypothetical protein
MRIKSKNLFAALLTVILISAIFVPIQAFAQSDTLGSEKPSLVATFTDSNQKVVDGNSLDVGVYTVSIKLSGMKAVSVFELTADYTDDIAITDISTIADKDSSFSVGAIVNENNSFVVILASENDDTSAIADGEAMITFTVTVNTAGDFADYFVVSSDIGLTFIEADYDDGIEPAYVLVGNEETEQSFPNITADMSPVLGKDTYSVTGKITIATNLDGTQGDSGIVGITASVDVNGETVSAVSDENGYYTLTGLPEGTYDMVFSGPTTIDRNVTLVVADDKAVDSTITVSAVPICVCDYVKSGSINIYDKGVFLKVLNGEDYEYSVYCDLVVSDTINVYDKGVFFKFLNSDVEYKDVTL